MPWDHQLLRKFCSTGHFRLISQLRSELKSHPLSRDPLTRKLIIEAKIPTASHVRENKRSLYNVGMRNGDLKGTLDNSKDVNRITFKDRLNSIDLR